MPDDQKPKRSRLKAELIPYLTPLEVAKHLRVGLDKVKGWIRRGNLLAIDLAKLESTKPKYRISLTSLKDFEKVLEVTTDPPPAYRSRRNRLKPKVDWFPEFSG